MYFETSSSSPYQIRRIEELIKTPNGNVEAKVMCFYRRRDISSSLIHLADKHQSKYKEEGEWWILVDIYNIDILLYLHDTLLMWYEKERVKERERDIFFTRFSRVRVKIKY